jgi:type II secretory pathway component PulF
MMADRSIQDIIAFNEELAALVAAGLPLDLGGTGVNAEHHQDVRSSTETRVMLDQVNTALSRRVGQGQTIEQAVSEEALLTSNLRRALLTYLRSDDARLALESLAAPASSRQRFATGLGSAMVYPMILLTVAYFGLLYLSQVTGTTIESMYVQLEQTPPTAVSLLSGARRWIPIWGTVVPLLVAVTLLWWHLRGSTMSWSWIPGSKRYYDAADNAERANQLAGMLESGCGLEESLQTVFPESTRIESLPPLLHWAIEADTGDEPLHNTLRFVARTYQQKAERQERAWSLRAPVLCGLAFGGLLVLGYGLCLFVPVVQLLNDVALPVSGLGGS